MSQYAPWATATISASVLLCNCSPAASVAEVQKLGTGYLSSGINVAAIGVDLGPGGIEVDGPVAIAERACEREADMVQADDGDADISVGHHLLIRL